MKFGLINNFLTFIGPVLWVPWHEIDKIYDFSTHKYRIIIIDSALDSPQWVVYTVLLAALELQMSWGPNLQFWVLEVPRVSLGFEFLPVKTYRGANSKWYSDRGCQCAGLSSEEQNEIHQIGNDNRKNVVLRFFGFCPQAGTLDPLNVRVRNPCLVFSYTPYGNWSNWC